jgi:hypothetical protein
VTFLTDSRLPFAYPVIPELLIFEEKTMKSNVGGIDRTLRVLVGLLLIGLAMAHMIGVWGWIGVLPLLTGVFGFCPAYLPFGLSTCHMHKQN